MEKLQKVVDLTLTKNQTVKDLVKQFSKTGGFSAAKLARGRAIWEKMHKENCKVFMSFPACIISTGSRGIIRDLVKNKKVDVLMTTCGTMDHDIARTLGNYYCGRFDMNDAQLRQEKKARLGNVIVKEKDYGLKVEDFMQKTLLELYKKRKEWNTRDLCWAVGERLGSPSLMYWAWKNKISVFIPGPMDGAFGCQLWMFYESHKDFKLNLFEDEHTLSELAFNAKKIGSLFLGGGISKHHVQWWNQFKGGADYAIQISSAQEWDGSLSGASLSEAVSWNQVQISGNYETITGDITVLLPLLVAE